jgi:hypothetical protein
MIATLAAALSAPTVDQTQRVDAVAYGCDLRAVTSISITVWSQKGFNGARTRLIAAPAKTVPGGGLRFAFVMPPGSFTIKYAAGARCESTWRGLTVLPGYDRNIVLSLIQYPRGVGTYATDWSSQKFVSGTLPFSGLAVSVIQTNDDGCPAGDAPEAAASVDNGAYYAGYFFAKHLFLRLRSSTLDILDIRLSDASGPNPLSEYVIRNVTLDDVRKLTTHSVTERNQCISAPSGDASTFDP